MAEIIRVIIFAKKCEGIIVISSLKFHGLWNQADP